MILWNTVVCLVYNYKKKIIIRIDSLDLADFLLNLILGDF